MFPWERAHMDGGARELSIWERVYWGLFATCMTYLLVVYAYRWYVEGPKEAERKKEVRVL